MYSTIFDVHIIFWGNGKWKYWDSINDGKALKLSSDPAKIRNLFVDIKMLLYILELIMKFLGEISENIAK